MDGLGLTGERTLPGIWHENYWLRRHEAGYRWLARGVTGRVLDAGCGEGYGAALLRAAGAAAVVAVDLDHASLRHARATYDGVTAVRGNLVALPLRDGSVDAVVASQVVEHVWDQPLFVRECVRVLRPGGRLLLSTPNRRTFPPGNVFHSRELDADELVALVEPWVHVQRVCGLRHGPRLASWASRQGDPVGAQLASAPEDWPDALARLVRAVDADDFAVDDDVATALDLLLVAGAA